LYLVFRVSFPLSAEAVIKLSVCQAEVREEKKQTNIDGPKQNLARKKSKLLKTESR